MKLPITIIFLLFFNLSFSQTNKNDLSLRVSAGGNEQPYFEKIWGHYLKAGVKYTVLKNVSILLSHEISESDNYPKDFKILYNNYVHDEQAFLNRFIGMSRNNWYSGKANFTSNSNSIYILQGTYDIYLGKKKQLLITPKFGYSYVKTKSFVTFISEASFDNDTLSGGSVKYENKILKLWGFHYGIEFAKTFGQKHKIFMEINKTADQTGGPNGYEFFEAFTVGIGFEIRLNDRKK